MNNELNNPNPLTSLFCMIICGITSMVASITNQLELWIRIGAGTVAFASGVFTIILVWNQIKKTRLENKKLLLEIKNLNHQTTP